MPETHKVSEAIVLLAILLSPHQSRKKYFQIIGEHRIEITESSLLAMPLVSLISIAKTMEFDLYGPEDTT